MTDMRPNGKHDAPGSRPVPLSTYRLQLNADFTLFDAAGAAPYLAELGVSHLYLSPILTAAPGSTHGYDVIDHSRIGPEIGGQDGFDALSKAAGEQELGLIVDLVPNHMAVPTPVWHNRELWSVLAEGPDSPYAHWFDVDWSAGNDALLMPVLGSRIGNELVQGHIRLDVPTDEERKAAPEALAGTTHVLRYHDHVFPVALGTESLPMAELLDRQHYRLAWWQIAGEELNYRRFFDVDTLAAIRVEEPDVFDATHSLVVDLLKAGRIDGLRIDHPDGLADPKGYLDRLAEATDHAWVVVEKILEHDEPLPDDWATAGTTGYDAAWRVQLSFIDPAGADRLGSLMHELAGDTPGSLPQLIEQAKREIISNLLQAEVHRLVTLTAALCDDDIRLRDHGAAAIRDAFVELLVEADRYRYYVAPGHPMRPEASAAFAHAIDRARLRLNEDRRETLDVLGQLLRGEEAGSAGRTDEARRHELMIRFQQVCGPVMAKAIEDTTFYRWTQLTGLNEVGGAPVRFAIGVDELHAWAAETVKRMPHTMTTLSTHDTKRSEDVRARLSVLSELPEEWATLLHTVRALGEESRLAPVDGRTENLLWQTLAGTWSERGPASFERLEAYLLKAVREAKLHTSWTAPDEEYEQAIRTLLRAALDSEAIVAAFTGWVADTREAVRATLLGQKLVQLMLPGVPDVYQGTEIESLTLVDPDNRQPIDFEALQKRLDRLVKGNDHGFVRPTDLDDEKLLIVHAALNVRRRLPEAFIGERTGYRPVPVTSGNAIAFARTVDERERVITIATRHHVALERHGGWGEHLVVLPEGSWRCVTSNRLFDGGNLPLADVLDADPVPLPVVLLVRDDVRSDG